MLRAEKRGAEELAKREREQLDAELQVRVLAFGVPSECLRSVPSRQRLEPRGACLSTAEHTVMSSCTQARRSDAESHEERAREARRAKEVAREELQALKEQLAVLQVRAPDGLIQVI